MKTFLIGAIILFAPLLTVGQDTIVLFNDDRVIGDFKELTRGVAKIETDYSDADFTIEWSGVKAIYSSKVFTLKYFKGDFESGTIKMDPSNSGRVILTLEKGKTVSVKLQDLVFLRDVDGGWTDRLSADVAVGASVARANNLQQFNASGHAGYYTQDWNINGTINSILSRQDSASRTRRTDASISTTVVITRGWFGAASANYLNNNEINLDYRINNRAGLGKNWFETNDWYFHTIVGLANNQEEFSGEDAATLNSWEAYFTFEVNLFDTGDLNLLANFTGFPSITESGRFRYDAKVDLKYDLPFDFFVKFGTTLNFDNQPSGGAVPLDYVFQTSFGWEL